MAQEAAAAWGCLVVGCHGGPLAHTNLPKPAVASSRPMCVWVNRVDRVTRTGGMARSRRRLAVRSWERYPILTAPAKGQILKSLWGDMIVILARVVCGKVVRVSLGLVSARF